jgi:hypothetical protein
MFISIRFLVLGLSVSGCVQMIGPVAVERWRHIVTALLRST